MKYIRIIIQEVIIFVKNVHHYNRIKINIRIYEYKNDIKHLREYVKNVKKMKKEGIKEEIYKPVINLCNNCSGEYEQVKFNIDINESIIKNVLLLLYIGI